MNNDWLVELIRKEQFYVRHRSPRYDEILEAIRRVDRRDFLPEEVVISAEVDSDLLESLHEASTKVVEDLHEYHRNSASDTKTVEVDEKGKNFLAMLDYVNKLCNSAVLKIFEPRNSAYENVPLSIGHGQTCSEPSMVAFMAYLLELKEGLRVFELGFGCGYSAAVTCHLIGAGQLVAAERIPKLALFGQSNLEAHLDKSNLKTNVYFICENGIDALENNAPNAPFDRTFDRIYLTAGVDLKSFDPSKLARHLNADDGILLFPEREGDLIKQRYKGGNLASEERYGNGKVRFVPLIL